MFTRRLFLASSSAALWVPALARAQSDKYHFTLGVASGTPRETSVILWTRLAPDPFNGGGMAPGLVDVRYRVCRDEAMRQEVRAGLVSTSHLKAHAVHARIDGLEPGREYFYQFYYGDDESPIGRTKTTDPRAGEARLALANCQAWETGYYAAYRDMAEWAPDAVIHVGDYIYEGGVAPLGPVRREYGGVTLDYSVVRQHNSPEITTLDDYRNRYALYRSDRHLQAAHAAAPWIVAMDDHEVDNNWAGLIPQDPDKQSDFEFAVRRQAAFQAFYEHMPIELPPNMMRLGGEMQMYGAYRFGPAQVNLLDTRQYRSDQVCGDGFPGDPPCTALDDPSRTMTGEVQEAWLLAQLRNSDARYNVLAQQTWFAPFDYVDDPENRKRNMDQWDGYPVQRQRIIDALASDVSNPVILSGDWHCAAAMTVHKDPDDPSTRPVAQNFAATSISSICSWHGRIDEARQANPHVKYANGTDRGYLRCIAGARDWTASFRTVADAADPDSPVSAHAEMTLRDM
ncbi:alkaline phosphatase D family protein [Henriciella pelagia]|jgi:alkaline phosphatase D|uniref:Alkaline phosphatase n=1 Tax=Henriciella pelagia TaxID=1977912 RepID=A0ABQ1JI75_9PROT|nr:alkaline phosphatase D family protein [Henriciella pelagia]GGB67423.1 alkaline phosphatase [Henriciella pelagia]